MGRRLAAGFRPVDFHCCCECCAWVCSTSPNNAGELYSVFVVICVPCCHIHHRVDGAGRSPSPRTDRKRSHINKKRAPICTYSRVYVDHAKERRPCQRISSRARIEGNPCHRRMSHLFRDGDQIFHRAGCSNVVVPNERVLSSVASREGGVFLCRSV